MITYPVGGLFDLMFSTMGVSVGKFVAVISQLPRWHAATESIYAELRSSMKADVGVYTTPFGEHVIEISSHAANKKRALAPEKTWFSCASPADMGDICKCNADYAIVVKPPRRSVGAASNLADSWMTGGGKTYLIAEDGQLHGKPGRVTLKWPTSTSFLVSIPPPEESLAQNKKATTTSLDDILGALYDASSGKATRGRVDELLSQYKSLTGKERPGFML